MNTSPLGLLAPTQHLPAILDGLALLGVVPCFLVDPCQGGSPDRSAWDQARAVLIILSDEMEDALEGDGFDDLLYSGTRETLFDEMKGRDDWDAARWAAHLGPKVSRWKTDPSGTAASGEVTGEAAGEPSGEVDEEATGEATGEWAPGGGIHEAILPDLEFQATDETRDAEPPSPPGAADAPGASMGQEEADGPEDGSGNLLDLPGITLDPSNAGEPGEAEATAQPGLAGETMDFGIDPAGSPAQAPADDQGLEGFSFDLGDLALVGDDPDSPMPPAADPPAPEAAPGQSVQDAPAPEDPPPAWQPGGLAGGTGGTGVTLALVEDEGEEEEAAAPGLGPATADAPPATRDEGGGDNPLPDAEGLVLIIGGTGGPAAIRDILTHLDPRLPVPVVICQPIPQGRYDVLATNLGRHARLEVAKAGAGQSMDPGTAWVLEDGLVPCQAADGKLVAEPGPVEQALGLVGQTQSAAVLVSGAPAHLMMAGMEAMALGGLLFGQDPDQAYEAEAIEALLDLGLVTGDGPTLGAHLAERWGVVAPVQGPGGG